MAHNRATLFRFWQSPEVNDALVSLLSFLSEDEYEFDFTEYKRAPTLDSYLRFGDSDAETEPESVVLFSGGLDSLAGAVEHVVAQGERALLVTHESTPKLRGRHRTLRSMLDGQATGGQPRHITVRIHKKDQREKDYTQRSRSFLYAALAAAVARMAGLHEIYFYENGVISLNLPLSPQVVGARATRTTHPRVLADMRRLFSLIAGDDFGVHNRFMWMTKTDVVQSLIDKGLGSMIPWSTSCTHTWNLSASEPHCGDCTQCIDRRFAVLAAGGGVHEPARSYRRDLLLDDRPSGESRIMLASYVELAQQVERMDAAAFFSRFGEAARALRHLDMPEDEAARKVFELYRRHGQQVVSVVDAALAEHSGRIRSRDLPGSCLLRLVHDPSVPSGSVTAPPLTRSGQLNGQPEYQFTRMGQGWVLRFNGNVTHLNHQIGLIYLHELIAFPRKRFTVAELFITARPDAKGMPVQSGRAAFDGDAAKAYHQRLLEVDHEIARAVKEQDITRAGVIEREKEDLLAEIRRAGFGRRRKVESRDQKRLRDRVRNAINRAIVMLGRYDKAAAAHFKDAIMLGGTPTYDPDDKPDWEF